MLAEFKDIEIAHDLIRSQIHRTPVLSSHLINEIAGAELYFKCENFQKTGSFKIRGATNSILNLKDEEKTNGVVAHSSGNHAQALAYAARANGIKAYIIMPNNAPDVKINAVRDYGADIIFCEPNIDARERETNKVIENKSAKLIHPYDYFNTICGQGTAAKELIEDCVNANNNLDYIIAPIGGGGLMSGTLISTKSLLPNCEVIGVEPEEVNDALLSWKKGEIVKNKTTNTICDGLLTNLGELNFKIISKYIDDILTVNDDEVGQAQLLIMQRMKIIIEPSSAVVFAAVLKNKDRFRNKKIGLIISGGNYDIKLSK
jgi:threonine dehydratase